jgi:hypothetical protein
LRGTWRLLGLYWHSRKPCPRYKRLPAHVRGFGEVSVAMKHNDFLRSRKERRLSRWIQLNWDALWPEIVDGLDQTLRSYQYEKTLLEILSDERNEISIDLSESRTNAGAAWSVSLNIELEHGGHVVYLTFNEAGKYDGGMAF